MNQNLNRPSHQCGPGTWHMVGPQPVCADCIHSYRQEQTLRITRIRKIKPRHLGLQTDMNALQGFLVPMKQDFIRGFTHQPLPKIY